MSPLKISLILATLLAFFPAEAFPQDGVDQAADSPRQAARKAAKQSDGERVRRADVRVTDPNVVQRQETYKTIGDVTLEIDVFEPKQKDPAKKYPAVVFFFGGGWVGGSPSQFYPHCEYLAGRGMIAMSAKYRVKSRHNTTPAECVKDGKSAVRWIRANAARLGVDPERLAAGGGSAGGHVAAAVATAPGFDEPDADLKISCTPNALILFNPVYDNGPMGYGHKTVGDLFPAISPLHNLKPGTPPTIVFLGTEDKLIPVATAESYRAKMQQNGDRSELRLYEGQPHGFFNYRGEPSPYYYRTLAETDKFLTSLGWLTGEPTIAAEKLQ